MKEDVIKVLKVKPHEHPEVYMLKNTLEKRPFYMCRHSTADVNSRCRDVRADAAGLEEAVLLTLKKQLEILLPVHKDGTIHLEATAAKCSEYEKQLEVLKDQKQALFERYLLPKETRRPPWPGRTHRRICIFHFLSFRDFSHSPDNPG